MGALALLGIACGLGAVGYAQQRVSPQAFSPISVGSSEQLFDTLSALYAAGYAANTTWRGESADTATYRAELRGMHGPAVDALRAYYKNHLRENPSEDLSQYASFGLVIGPPPRFVFEFARDALPPDVLGIEDFTPKLAAFYAEANLARRWKQFQPQYDRQVYLLRAPVSRLITQTNGYLREVLKSTTTRQFDVILEPLIGSRTNFRIYGERYMVVVSSGEDPPVDEIRHAYLHFLLDPLAFRYGRVMDTRRALIDVAARAPRLPEQYLQDFPAFFTECLIRAVELRFQKLPLAQLDEAFGRQDADGFVLVRPLYDGLQKFEQSDPAMTFYYPDLIESVNVVAVEKRFQNYRFAPVDLRSSAPAEPVNEASQLDEWLTDGDNGIATHNLSAAEAAFQKALERYPDNLKAMYGMAVVSVLKGDAAAGEHGFQRVVETAAKEKQAGDAVPPDPSVVAWSHVYLGRIYDLSGERHQSVSEYQAALATDGIPDAARKAAQDGLQTPYKVPANGGAPRRP